MANTDELVPEIDAEAEPIMVPELGVAMEPVGAPAIVETKTPSMLFLVGSLVGGNVTAMGLRMVGGILQAKCVLPAVLGLFGSIGLVLGYAPFLQLGILNGINRELPYFIGKGDRKRVLELAAAAQAWAIAVGVAVGVALAGIACWQLILGHWELAAGWFTNAILAVLLFYNTYYLQMTYRTGHDFARLAMSTVIENAVALVLVGLVALLNFYGICLRALLTSFVSVAFLYYWRPVRVGPHWNWPHLKHLFVIGAPIFIVGQLYAWWTVLNSTLVFSYMGNKGMGLYSMVLVAGGAMELLPVAVNHVMYPRMAEQYGRTGQLGDLIRMAIKPVLLSVAGVTLLIVVGWWLMEPVVRLILPNYVEAVPAMQWAILLSIVSSFATLNAVFNVVRRQRLYCVAIALGMAAYGGSLMWLIRGGVSLVAFPQAMLVGQAVFVLVCYLFVLYLMREDRRAT